MSSEHTAERNLLVCTPGRAVPVHPPLNSLALHQFTESMSGPHEYPEIGRERERESRRIKTKHPWLSLRKALYYHSFFSIARMPHGSCLCVPRRNLSTPLPKLSKADLKALSGDHSTSPHPLWVIPPSRSGHLARSPTTPPTTPPAP